MADLEWQRETALAHHGVDRAVFQADEAFHVAPRNESIFRSRCRHSEVWTAPVRLVNAYDYRTTLAFPTTTTTKKEEVSTV